MNKSLKIKLALGISAIVTLSALLIPSMLVCNTSSLVPSGLSDNASVIQASASGPTLSDNHVTDEIRLIAVKMDAVWCGRCQVMNPKLDNVRPTFAGQPVLFVKFDMTDDFTTYQSSLLADRLNLTELYNNHAGKTGYLVLIDPRDGSELAVVTSDLSEEAIRLAVEGQLNNMLIE
ncbi:MAG: Thioredoxin [Bacteroidetes bacterium HLUCCA01]|nr:MAG: Thioredoxin [Bacteroidetes bacterium HLUCCA01]